VREGSYARLGRPRPVRVRADANGRPLAVGGRPVEAVRESWLVEDRWWTDAPLRRRYWEVVTEDGRDVVVFRDLQTGGWHGQRS
jgi:CO dehydrogenase/acetyl-CoA synthase delta subunit